MIIGEIAAIVVAVAAIVTGIIAAQRYNANKRDEIKDGAESARGRIYERIDEKHGVLMAATKDEYARKDMCILTHQQTNRELKEIREMTALIPKIAAQLNLLVNGAKKSG